MADPAAGGGLLRSLRRLAERALEMVELRLALLGTELEQEKLRLFGALLRALVGLLLLTLALVLALAFLLLLLQEAYRLPALGLLALGLGAAAAWLLKRARAALQSGPQGLFGLSVEELRADRAAVRGAASSGPDEASARSASQAPSRSSPPSSPPAAPQSGSQSGAQVGAQGAAPADARRGAP